MALKLNNIFFILITSLVSLSSFSQESDGPKPPKVTDYKSDSSYNDYSSLRFKVAKAQINKLKNGGALLVRLKTNANTISKLKAAGNIDIATQVERETHLTNKIIVASYLQEFTFCPVYFFYSNSSDSVKNQKLNGIFIDTNLVVDPTIVCNANFYLIAESDKVYNSSLGIVPESKASQAIERGTPSREAPIVVKNRYFIQLHKPFPFFQIQQSNAVPIVAAPNGVYINLSALHTQVKKEMNKKEAKRLIKFKNCVRGLSISLDNFYTKNVGYEIPANLSEYVY
jgi:hypothetical protein